MPKSAYPTSAEVIAKAASIGVTLSSGQATEAVAAAVAYWESLTHSPWLKESTFVAYTLPHGGAQIRGLPFPVVEVQSLTVDGQTLTVDQDYFLMPRGAPLRKSPYTSIEFKLLAIDGASGVVMSCKRGWRDDIPEDVWSAIQAYAVALGQLEVTAGMGPVKKLKEDTVEIEYALEAGRDRMGRADMALKSLAGRYRMVV